MSWWVAADWLRSAPAGGSWLEPPLPWCEASIPCPCAGALPNGICANLHQLQRSHQRVFHICIRYEPANNASTRFLFLRRWLRVLHRQCRCAFAAGVAGGFPPSLLATVCWQAGAAFEEASLLTSPLMQAGSGVDDSTKRQAHLFARSSEIC